MSSPAKKTKKRSSSVRALVLVSEVELVLGLHGLGSQADREIIRVGVCRRFE